MQNKQAGRRLEQTKNHEPQAMLESSGQAEQASGDSPLAETSSSHTFPSGNRRNGVGKTGGGALAKNILLTAERAGSLRLLLGDSAQGAAKVYSKPRAPQSPAGLWD